MTHKIFVRLSLLLWLVVMLSGCGEKAGFAISEFKVTKNGATLFEDKFDGSPLLLTDPAPPSTTGFQWIGKPAIPKNKKALLAYEQAVPNVTNPMQMANTAILETNIDPAEGKAGLKPGMTFDVTGTFDMTLPEKIEQGFYIGLTDGQIASGGHAGSAPRDSIMLGYTEIKRGTRVNIVFFRSTDYMSDPNGSITNTTFALIDPEDGDQIKLRISKDDAAGNRVTALYAMVKQGVAGPYVKLQQSTLGAGYMPIFREHAYTRPMFGTFWPKQQDGSGSTGNSAASSQANASGKQISPPLSNTNPNAREELIEFATREVRAKALLTYESGKKPLFVAVMIPGGAGNFQFESTKTGIAMLNAARLQNRLRPLLLQRGIASALLDAPDDNPEMLLSFRESKEHLTDLESALAEIGRRFPGVPLVVIGHSMGTWSAAFLAKAEPEKIGATVLIDPVLQNADVLNRYDRYGWVREGLSKFDWNKLKRSVLLIHHRKDDCLTAPYKLAAEVAQRYKRIHLLTIDSEKDVSTGYCGLSGPHNEDGHEELIANSIKTWGMQQIMKRQ